MKKHKIHQSNEERIASTSEGTFSALNKNIQKTDEVVKAVKGVQNSIENRSDMIAGFSGVLKSLKKNNDSINELKDYIDYPEKVVSKLEEVKSAHLITNQELKKLNKKEAPTVQKVELMGAEIVTIKGKPGDKGEPGNDGKDGKDGEKGDRGEMGPEGKPGKDSTVPGPKGDRGNDGKDGKDGRDGLNGLDGSPDSPDEIVTKINDATLKIEAKAVKGLLNVFDYVDHAMRNPSSILAGGSNSIRFNDSTGSQISAYVTQLQFGTGLTPTYANGVITITSAGTSPLTTKGDIYTYSTADARLAVGTNGYILSADSAEVTGLKWIPNASASAWNITGNAGLVAGTNFLGTTDAVDVVFKRNSVEQARLVANQLTLTPAAGTYTVTTGAVTDTLVVGVTGATSNSKLSTLQDSFSLLLNGSTPSFWAGVSADLNGLALHNGALVNWYWPLADSTGTQALVSDGFGTLSWATIPAATTTLPISSLTAATGTNSIDNGTLLQEWQWNTLDGNSGLKLSSTSTAASGNLQKVFEIALSGANGTASQTTYGSYITNTHTGTSSTNVGGYFSASGGTTNYGLIVAAGNVGIGTSTPSHPLQVNMSANIYAAINTLDFAAPTDSVTAGATLWLSRPSDAGRTSYFGSYQTAGNAKANAVLGSRDDIVFMSNSSEKMRMLGNGNLGIGVTSPTAALHVTKTAGTGTQQTVLLVTAPAHTNLTATFERADIYFLLSATKQWATGNLTTQRAMIISNPTYAFVGASTINDAYTVEISGAPIAGTNATITRSWALAVSAGNTQLAGNVFVGATAIAPTAHLHLAAGTASASTAPLKFTSGTSLTAAEAGAMEFTTDDLFFTITTGAARKNITLWDTLGTSGRIPFATTNGRLTDDADLTFATDTLTATKIVGTTSIKVGTAAGYISSDGSTGATGTIDTSTSQIITVKDGIITSIV